MVNPNSHGRDPASQSSASPTQFDVIRLTDALADLKAAVGKLWKKVDEAQLASQAGSHKVQEKIDTWTQTNRVILESNQELIKAIVQNSQETQASIKSSERGSQLLATLTLQLQQFEQVIRSLEETSIQPNIPSPSSAATNLQPIKTQLNSLKAAIANLSVELPIKFSNNLNEIKDMTIGAGNASAIALLFILVAMGGNIFQFFWFNNQLSGLQERTRWQQTKLERLEKALGVQK